MRVKQHRKLSRKILGFDNPMVDRILDMPSPKREHRWRHTPGFISKMVEVIAKDDVEGREVRLQSWLHLLVDWDLVAVDSFENKTKLKRKPSSVVHPVPSKSSNQILMPFLLHKKP